MNLMRKALIVTAIITPFLFSVKPQAQIVHVQSSPAKKSGGVHTDSVGPIVGAHVYMFEVGTHGPNTAPFSLIDCSAAGVSGPDSLGNCYVVTQPPNGTADFTGLYYNQCDYDTSLIYIQATGGSAINDGVNNPQISNIAVIPYDCYDTQSAPGLYVGEQTAVAAAYAVAPMANLTAVPKDGFATKNASMGALMTAFKAANNVFSSITGTFTTSDSTAIEQFNTVADVIASCVDTDGGSGSGTPCGTLYSYTTANFTPTDTYLSALSMTENPRNNFSNLYSLVAATPPWTPYYTSTPPTGNWNQTISGAPVLSSLSVTHAAVGSHVTITGSNLESGSTTPTVIVNGLQATVYGTPSSSSVTFTVPSGALASGYVGVYTSTYSSNFLPFSIP